MTNEAYYDKEKKYNHVYVKNEWASCALCYIGQWKGKEGLDHVL